MTALRLGTRRSRLATTQSTHVAELLRARGHEVELVEIVTEGDRSNAPLEEIGGTGVFASTLRAALRRGEVDLAVHSLKDLPTAPEPGLVIASIPAREDVRDAVIARDGLTLGELPPGAQVGTGSPRREVQVRALGFGLEITPIRGNVETRIGLVASGALDAVILAWAGLRRMGLAERATEVLDPIVMLPAAGQGALAIECRADNDQLIAILREIDDPDTRLCTTAERTVLRELEAGCIAPVGVLGEVVDSEDGLELSLRAFVGSRDGSVELRRSLHGPADDPEGLARALAQSLLQDGAAQARIPRPGAPGIEPPPVTDATKD